MKRTILTGALAVALVIAMTGVAGATIIGSKHDLSGNYTNSNANRVCAYCHTPHRGGTTAPLWNRVNSSVSYTMYNKTHSSTIDMTVGAGPGSFSLVCLSCHDATVTYDTLVNAPGSGGYNGGGADQGWTLDSGKSDSMPTTSVAYVGNNLTDDHPIAITYNRLLDSDFNDQSTAESNGVAFFNNDKVECASCHDVHEPGTAAAGTAPFLIVNNNASNMCRACHTK